MRQLQGRSCPQGSFSAAPAAHGKAFLSIDAEDLLVVDLPALTFQQNGETAIAKPSPFIGQLAQPLPEKFVLAGLLLILECGAIQFRQSACPTFAQAVGIHHMVRGPARRFTSGVRSFLWRDPSGRHCPAWHRPATASAWRSRLPTPEASWHPKPSCRQTWPCICRTSRR